MQGFKQKRQIAILLVLTMILSFVPVYGQGVNAETVKEELSSQNVQEDVLVQVEDTISRTAKWIKSTDRNFSAECNSNLDWDVFALSRCEAELNASEKANYIINVAKYIKEQYKQNGGLDLPTDYSRIAISLSSLGLDPTNFDGVNLLKDLYNDMAVTKIGTQGINAYIYGLIAANAAGYETEEGSAYSKPDFADNIIKLQKEEGYFVYSDEWGADYDITATAVQALAPYYNDDSVKATVDKATSWLSSQMTENAGFSTWGSENSQTPAQVVAMLAGLDINPIESSEFVKSENNLFTNILGFANEDGSFSYSSSYPGANAMATQQVLYGLNSLKRFLLNENWVYDLSDVNKIVSESEIGKLNDLLVQAGSISPQEYSEDSYSTLQSAIKKAETICNTSSKSELWNSYIKVEQSIAALVGRVDVDDGKIPSDGSVESAYISINVEAINKGYILPKTLIELKSGDTPYTILVRAIGEKDVKTTGSGDSIYVYGIKKAGSWIKEFDYGSGSGWIFKVNGIVVQKGCNNYKLDKGDVVEWVYTADLGDDIGGGSSTVGSSSSRLSSITVTPSPLPTLMPVNLYENEIKLAVSNLLSKEQLDDWDIVALSAYGTEIPAYSYERIKNEIIENQGEYRKVTDLERVALAVSALGKDAANVEGYNLIEKIYNNENMTMQGLSGPVFALITLDSRDYKAPDNAIWNRDKLIEYILSSKNTDGGFALEKDSESDVDITAMAIQAMSSYLDNDKVKSAVEKAKEYLVKAKNSDGSYSSNEVKNSESIAQVIIALNSIGEGADKTGELDALLKFYKDGGFSHELNGEADDMSTAQGLIALISNYNYQKGLGTVYKFTVHKETFDDMNAVSDWARDSVKKAKELGVIKGYDGKFSPLQSLTRAEFTSIIIRLLEIDYVDSDVEFSDVGNDDWYSRDVKTAYKKGFIKGVTNTEFAPDDEITREEMAVMLNRIYDFELKDKTQINDINLVSDWAKDSVEKVYSNEIITGYENNFEPQESVTREMAAVVCIRLIKQ